MLLELVDLAIRALPFALMAEMLHALDEDASVVAAIEHGHVAGARQVPPEAPEIMMRLLVALRRGISVHGEPARIEHFGDALDRATFAGGVPAFKHAQQRDPVPEYLEFQLTKPELRFTDLVLILRLGELLVGINLLREGLDLPEVSLVAILDADKEGFLRSDRSLIQTMGRAARNANGKYL